MLPRYNHDNPVTVVNGGITLPRYNHDDPVAVVNGGVMLPKYNHDDPAAVVNGSVTLPGYNHDHTAAVVNGRLYVGWMVSPTVKSLSWTHSLNPNSSLSRYSSTSLLTKGLSWWLKKI